MKNLLGIFKKIGEPFRRLAQYQLVKQRREEKELNARIRLAAQINVGLSVYHVTACCHGRYSRQALKVLARYQHLPGFDDAHLDYCIQMDSRR